MGKIVGQTEHLSLDIAIKGESSEFKPIVLRLKIDLVPYPLRTEGVGKYISSR